MHALDRIGVTTTKQNQFFQKGITSVEELVCFFPRKYYDLRVPLQIADLKPGVFCVVHGLVLDLSSNSSRAISMNRITLQDESGDRMCITFFGDYPFKTLEKGKWYYFAGKIQENYWVGNTMTNPPIVTASPCVCRLMPIYSKIKGMSKEYLEKKLWEGIAAIQADIVFGDKDILAKHLKLPSWVDALKTMHSPSSIEALKSASKRIAMEDIYDFYDSLNRQTKYTAVTTETSCSSRTKMDSFIQTQPFELTKDQNAVIESIVERTQAGKRVNAIISGDVGSGKTMVAASIAAFMAENGYQSTILAPTLILAKQHYNDFNAKLSDVGFKVALLTGETKKKERTAILSGVADGSIQILIGTHAVLSNDVKFQKLGLTVVDEEHKFGVAQKARMEAFAQSGAHHLSMTATPIPRSMAMGVYGDNMEVLAIHTMPEGRKPTITKKVTSLDDICDSILLTTSTGHQAYVVCPFIADSDTQGVWSVEAAEAELRKRLPSVSITSISGDMNNADILQRVDEFSHGKVQVLVSTTIVEVGVNIPNATLIAVLSANHFGLAALHQLRGRVGRSSVQGCCLLLPDKDAEKLDILCSTNDGFVVAEEDMRLRGPGNLLGVEQTGENHAIEQIFRYPNMAANIKRWLSRSVA